MNEKFPGSGLEMAPITCTHDLAARESRKHNLALDSDCKSLAKLFHTHCQNVKPNSNSLC